MDRITEVYPLKHICDNDAHFWGKTIGNGIEVISPKRLSECRNCLVVIAIGKPEVAVNITKQLLSMGITNIEHVYNWIRVIEENEQDERFLPW